MSHLTTLRTTRLFRHPQRINTAATFSGCSQTEGEFLVSIAGTPSTSSTPKPPRAGSQRISPMRTTASIPWSGRMLSPFATQGDIRLAIRATDSPTPLVTGSTPWPGNGLATSGSYAIATAISPYSGMNLEGLPGFLTRGRGASGLGSPAGIARTCLDAARA